MNRARKQVGPPRNLIWAEVAFTSRSRENTRRADLLMRAVHAISPL